MLATPLTSLQLCLQDSVLPAKFSKLDQAATTKNFNTSLNRISDIFNFFTNQGIVSTKVFLVAELLSNLKVFFPSSQNQVTIQYLGFTKLAAQNFQLKGNLFLLEEALLCLIKNGLEAYQKKDEKFVTVTAWQKQNQLHISIRDFGSGMPRWKKLLCQLPHITFKQNGSGIGLPFARSIIEKHYLGNIIINSIPNLGTEVICVIPLYQ